MIYYSEQEGILVGLGTSSTQANFQTVPFTDFILTSIDDPDCMDLSPVDTLQTLSKSNSNAFIDLDGDCLPDLFLIMSDGTNDFYRVFVQRLI